MHGKKVLVVDDDINLCQSIKIGFAREGADVIIATDGDMGIERYIEHKPDLVILDIRLPERDGWETCRKLRQVSDVPIIMLTSLNQERDIIRGLKCGADDFVSKPFSRNVLAAKAEVIMRRRQENDVSLPQKYQDDYLQINLAERIVVVQDEQLHMTTIEFKILAFLVENANSCVTYEALLNHVWGWEYRNDKDYVQVYISHLRRKIEKDPRSPSYIMNEYGIGYRFNSTATPVPV